MDKIKIEQNSHSVTGEITEYVIIDLGNGSFRSMPKSEYDRLQAEQSTPIESAE